MIRGAGQARGSAFRALRHRDYRWYFLSGLGTSGAQGIQQFAIAWLVLDLTDSLGKLGIVIFMQGVPMSITSVFGGLIVDRYNRRNVLILSQLVQTVCLGALAVLTVAGVVEIWQVYVISVFLGITMAITIPARNALIRSLVEPEDVLNAVALNSTQFQAGRIIFPSFGGGMIALVGVDSTLVVAAACSLIGVLLLMVVRAAAPEAGRVHASAAHELAEGFRYVLTTPYIRMVLSMSLSVAMFGLAFMALAPGFAREVMDFNATEAGLFVTASGIGAVVGSAVLVMLDVRDQTRLFVFSTVSFSLSVFAIAVNPTFAGAFLFMAAFGFANSTLSIAGQTIFQMVVPQRLLGRVVSLWSLTAGLAFIAALPIGLLGDLVGLRWVLGSGALFLSVATFVRGFSALTGRTSFQTEEDEPDRVTRVGALVAAEPERQAPKVS